MHADVKKMSPPRARVAATLGLIRSSPPALAVNDMVRTYVSKCVTLWRLVCFSFVSCWTYFLLVSFRLLGIAFNTLIIISLRVS